MGNHGTHVVGDDLEVWALFHNTGKHQTRHGQTGIEDPAEYLIQDILRGPFLPELRMDPYRRTRLIGLFKKGPEFRLIYVFTILF